tara:strand:- start:228 stop:398 length:171 start_codon:yes stop_codon:yes gene_type:complete
MKITCDRPLGEEEREELIHAAKILEVEGGNETWTGDGTLYRTTSGKTFHFVDQKWK